MPGRTAVRKTGLVNRFHGPFNPTMGDLLLWAELPGCWIPDKALTSSGFNFGLVSCRRRSKDEGAGRQVGLIGLLILNGGKMKRASFRGWGVLWGRTGIAERIRRPTRKTWFRPRLCKVLSGCEGIVCRSRLRAEGAAGARGARQEDRNRAEARSERQQKRSLLV